MCYIAVAAAGKKADQIADRLLLEVIKPLLSQSDRLTPALDDTPTERYGSHVQGVGIHHNPTPGPAGSPHVYGHVFVVLGLLVKHKSWGVIALPLLARLYDRKTDLPKIDPKHRPEFRTKLVMAVELLQWALPLLKSLAKPLWVVADGAYAKEAFLKPAMAMGFTVVSRLRKDAIGVGKAHWFEPPLPPNRAGGSPAHGSPVGGLTSKRMDETSTGHGQFQQPRLGGQGSYPCAAPREEGRQQPCRPLQRFEPRHVCLARSGALSPYAGYRQSHRGIFRRLELHASTFLHPFAPPELPGFDATMGALTPARRVLRTGSIMNARLVRAGLSASCVWPSDHSASNHPTDPMIAFTRYPSASWTSGSPRSGLRLECAGSPNGMAESSSLALRTGHSPPVAPHPASRRRSYHQLQAGERVPEEDSHLSDQTHLQTHALRSVPGPRVAGRRGRPRIYGPEGLDLAKRAGQKRGWTTETFDLYGRSAEKRYKTFLATWGPVGGVVRVVLVDEPTGWMAFFCTDAEAIVSDILATVADRFSLEITFRDCKEVVGAGQQQVRFVWANIGCFHVCMWTFTLTEAWAWARSGNDLVDRSASPWDSPTRRPSHADKRRAWRRELLGEEIRAVLRPSVTEAEMQAVANRLVGLAA